VSFCFGFDFVRRCAGFKFFLVSLVGFCWLLLLFFCLCAFLKAGALVSREVVCVFHVFVDMRAAFKRFVMYL